MPLFQQTHDCHAVLVVDDDPQIVRSLQHLLERDDHDVFEALGPEQALDCLNTVTPCLAIIDVHMPGIDGIELCRRLHDNPRSAHVPVVLMTGQVRPGDVEAGALAGAVDFIRKPFDVEEVRMRVRTQIRLHEALMHERRVEKQLRVVTSAAMDAIIILDGDGNVAHWNQAAERMFGYAATEVMGKNAHALLAPARFHERHGAAFSVFQDTGRGAAVGKSVELYALRKSGEEFPVELSLASAELDGRWHAVGILRDITERKSAEQRLRTSEARLGTIMDNVTVGIALIGLDRKLRWVNQPLVRMLGASSAEDVTGVLCHGRLCSASSGRCPVVDEGQVVDRRECALRRNDGSATPVLKSACVLEFDGERVLLETFVDLTTRKQLEAELSHARKLEAVGQLAAGIAHEINTPAQYVGDSMHFLEDAFEAQAAVIGAYRKALGELCATPGHENVAEAVREAEQEADMEFVEAHTPGALARCFEGLARVSTIVRAMKEFAHPDQREKSPADLNQAVQTTLVIARNEYKYVAEVTTELGELPLVECHVGDLNQVFLNLIVNAAHAIGDIVKDTGDKGRIVVRSSHEGASVVFEFEDTGSGIPETIAHRIFEPFFTTKEVGKGSGQGLAIARSVVVDKHHGSLTFRSAPGKGTTFVVRLPIDGKQTVS
jgi:two-component system, NtrC family, sensor kinase